jgi:hypothetical protein
VAIAFVAPFLDSDLELDKSQFKGFDAAKCSKVIK